MTPEDVLEKLQPWKQSHRRMAYFPVVSDGESAPMGSRFGGLPFLPEGQSVPKCGGCDGRLRMLLQIDLATLPAEASPELGSKGILQVFYCRKRWCEEEETADLPFSDAHHIRVLQPGAGSVSEPYGKPFPAKAISGWKSAEDFPHASEHLDLGLRFEHDFKKKRVIVTCPAIGLKSPPFSEGAVMTEDVCQARDEDKLLGWPYWVQEAEYPECRTCRRPMAFLLQLASEEHLPTSWGDNGILTAFRCAEHVDQFAMSWAGS